MKIIITFLLIVSAQICIPSEGDGGIFTTRNGKVFTGVTNVEVVPSGVKVYHSDGLATVRYDNLTDDQIEKYGICKKQAEEFIAKEKDKLSKAHLEKIALAEKNQEEKYKRELESKYAIQVNGSIFQVVREGVLFNGHKQEKYTATEQTESKSLWNQTSDPRFKKEMVNVQVSRTRQVPIGNNHDNLSFIECSTDNLSDNDNLSGKVYPCGTYSYETTFGAAKTIPKYTVSVEAFLNYKKKVN